MISLVCFFLLSDERFDRLTVYKTSFPELLGLPADLRGADSSTSGVNLAARMVIIRAGEEVRTIDLRARPQLHAGKETKKQKGYK